MDIDQSIKNYLEEKIDNINKGKNKIEKDDESLLGENFKDLAQIYQKMTIIKINWVIY